MQYFTRIDSSDGVKRCPETRTPTPHYNLVLRVDVKTVQDWSEDVVISRWKNCTPSPELVVMYQKNPKSSGVDVAAKALIDNALSKTAG